MTSSDFAGDDPDDLAGEYVIGTLDSEERATFAARLRDDSAAQEAVAEWERRFAGLAFAVDAVAPKPETWSRIERDLRLADARLQRFRVIEGGGRGSAGSEYIVSRNRWRAAALVSSAVAAALVLFVAFREGGSLQPRESSRTFVAAVNRGGDKPALIIRVDLTSKRVFVRPVAAVAPAGHSLELWYVADGSAPRSMGIIDAAPSSIAMPSGPALGGNTSFAVSVEPQGGSKTGGPTGPVLYSGILVPN